ncbi:MAG TPA: hypothetical protein VK427_20850, partial [Kofleriaceae bacterium]|nr:hypothetical protein [Kofleriaceae bacterium]
MMRALAIGLLCAACSGDARPTLESVEGVEELDQALADLTSQCTYVSGTLTLALEAGDIALFARTAAGAITINGFACGSATAASTTSIVVSDASSGAQTVILDLRGGMLGASRGMTP